MPHPTLTLWRFTDGKPGHEKQSLGLARALQRQTNIDIHDIDVRNKHSGLLDWLLGRFPAGKNLPPPDLLIGAGHSTHLPMLAARRTFGGKIVVLMRPSLPLRLFDLCLIPEHDNPPDRDNVIVTRGALNAVTPTGSNYPDRGLILVGGPSSHYAWDDQSIAAQIMAIARASPELTWQLTTSRRTPDTFLDNLPKPLPANLNVLPHTITPDGWLETNLCESGQAWVTEDSVSMLYEALTAGCAVGLLCLSAGGNSRIGRGVAGLIHDHWVTPYAAWQNSGTLTAPAGHFNEAERCAQLILAQWPNNAN